MKEKINESVERKKAGWAMALLSYSALFYASVAFCAALMGISERTTANRFSIVAISCGVLVPLMSVAYGVMAGIMGKAGVGMCFANGAFTALLVCGVYDFDEIYGRLGVCVCLFVGAFSFSAMVAAFVKGITALKNLKRKKNF